MTDMDTKLATSTCIVTHWTVSRAEFVIIVLASMCWYSTTTHNFEIKVVTLSTKAIYTAVIR